LAVANSILDDKDVATCLGEFAMKYYHLPYGRAFKRWVKSWDRKPYNSFGNGSAMRVSPVGFAYDSVEDVLANAKRTAEVTHNHPEGIKGAQSTALAIFLARKGEGKEVVRQEISGRFDYDLDRTVDEIRPSYRFSASCMRSVPESIIAFLDSTDYESAVRNAISLGGDADTMACIAGGIAQAYYKMVPTEIVEFVRTKLPRELLNILDQFNKRFGVEFQ
jgi:ADP-ribosylglycohydrolase